MLKEAKNTNKFFKCVGSVHNLGNGGTYGGLKSAYMALTEEEFEDVSNSCFTSELNINMKREREREMWEWEMGEESSLKMSIENQEDSYISDKEDLDCFIRGLSFFLYCH